MPLPTFCSRKEATTKNANTLTLTMLRSLRQQIHVEENRQRCRETLQTFNLADNVSTVLQSIHFAAPSRHASRATRRHRRSGAAAASSVRTDRHRRSRTAGGSVVAEN